MTDQEYTLRPMASLYSITKELKTLLDAIRKTQSELDGLKEEMATLEESRK